MANEGHPAEDGPASYDIRQGCERVLDNKRSYLRRISICEVYCDGTTERKSIDNLIISRNWSETQGQRNVPRGWRPGADEIKRNQARLGHLVEGLRFIC